MKKWLITLTLLLTLGLSQAAFAADWRPVEGFPGITWNADGLQYITDDNGAKINGDLVIVSIKRPIPPEVIQQIAAGIPDETIKKEILTATHEVRNYCYSIPHASISYAGAFLVTADGEIVGEQQAVTEFALIPPNSAVSKVYEYLKTEVAAGRIK